MRIETVKPHTIGRTGRRATTSRRRSGARRWALAAAALAIGASVVGAPPANGEDAPDGPLRAFFEPVDVPLVNVDVYVADRDGRPVPGLTADDFRVFEDGEPVEVSHFYAAPGLQQEAPVEPVEATVVEEPQVRFREPSQRLFLVILVDNTNLGMAQRRQALENLRTIIQASLPQELQVMVVTYDGDIKVRRQFAPVGEDLGHLLDDIAGESSLTLRTEEDSILREMQNAAKSSALTSGSIPDANSATDRINPKSGLPQQGDTLPDEFRQRIESHAQAVRDRTQHTLGVFEQFVRSLSGLPGRKALVVVTDGIQVRPGQRLFEAFEWMYDRSASRGGGGRAFLSTQRYDLTSELEELTRYANANRVSFYMLSNMADRQISRVSAASGGEAMQAGFGIGQMVSEEQALNTLAGGTGGRVVANSPGLGDQLEEVAEELESYYSLAYEPSHVGDGKYHRIRVEVDRPGVKIRHREGYLDVGQEDRMADETLSAAVLGVTENPLGVRAEVQTMEPRKDGTFLVPILIQIPLGQLVLVPGPEAQQGRITVFLATQDAEGGLSDVQRREYPVEVANRDMLAAAGKDAAFVLGLAMRPGPQRVAVGVRDDVARVQSTVTLDLEVGGENG